MARSSKPGCPVTKKVRYRDGHDAMLALRSVRRRRARAERDGVPHRNWSVRRYECPDCGGWHLTSQPAPEFRGRPDRTPPTGGPPRPRRPALRLLRGWA